MRCSIAILTLSVIAANLLAQVIPSWWSSRNVFESGTSADDFVAVNQGQLKTFAEATVAEFNARFPGGAGNTLNALVASWSMPAAGTDDYQVVTVGQLKALGDLFYQRIEQIRLMRVPDWSPIVPSWSGQGMNVPGNADVVNIGQVKELFNSLEGNRRAFVTGGSDNLSDTGRLGLSWWMDSDDDGHSDLEELLHGSNPDDATAQPPLRLELVSGNGQWIGAAEILAAPVVVAVKRGYASLAGMQVLAALPSGTDVGSLASAASGPWQSSITLTTDTAGQARIWWKAPSSMAPRPYAFFARLSPVSAGTQISLFANARPADPSAPLTLARGEATVLSKPVGSLTLQTLTLVITRSGLIQAGIPTRLTVHGEGGRIALSPQGPWRQQIDAPTGADGRIACHWRSSRSQPGSGSVRVSVPGQTTEPTTLIIPTTSQLPYVLTVLSGPALLRGAGSSHALPVLVLVTQGGAPVKDATVHLSVSQTGGQISSTAAGPWGKSVTLTTDIQGQAQAWWRGESTVAGGAVTVNLPDQPAVAPVTLPSATTPPDTNDDPNSDGLSPTQRLLGRLPYEITVRRQVVNVLESGATGIDDPVDEPTEGPLIRTTKHKYGPENFPGVSRSVQVDEDTTFREGEEPLWWQRPDKLSWELGSNKSYDEPKDEPTQTYGWNKSWRGVTFEFRIRPKAQAEPGAKLVLPYLIETLKPNIASYLPQTVISSESGVLELVVNGQPDQEDKRSVTCVLPYEGNNSDVKRMRVRLLPVEVKVVNRDDPKKRWADAKDHSSSKPIYAGESCGDMVSWRLGSAGVLNDTTITWTAEGPGGQTITGPTGAGKNEWTINDNDEDTATDWLKWKPGTWKIKIQIGSTQTEFEQEIGVRTEQYFAVGTIPDEAPSTNGVDPRIITQWGCAPGATGQPMILIASLHLLGGAINNSSRNFFVPLDEANRVYVNHRLLSATRNLDPVPAIQPEKPVTEACGLDSIKHYRGFTACQFKFITKNNQLDAMPELISGSHIDLVGRTPLPCQTDNNYGTKGESHADSGKVTGNVGDAEFFYLSKFRVGNQGQQGFKMLNGRIIPWVFFRFRFEAKEDGLIDTKFDAGQSHDPVGPDAKDFSTVPTWLVYRRYYDLQENKWNVQQVRKIDENRRPFFSIGTEVPSSPYVLP